MKLWIILILLFGCQSPPDLRPSSAPYISGDSFRKMAQHIYDETGNHVGQVKVGDLLFVKADLLEEFLQEVWPQITVPVKLLTHNADCSCPGPYRDLLEDEKLLAWYGQNIEGEGHLKLQPLPIGLANRRCPHGDIEILEAVKRRNHPKKHFLYMNIVVSTNPTIRQPVIDQFQGKDFVTQAENRSYCDYLTDMAESKFVLAPRGNGLDCHRTYEALLMGAYPIVQHSSLDSLFVDLPVVLIDSWDEITEAFLLEKEREFENKSYNLEKLTIAYWETIFK